MKTELIEKIQDMYDTKITTGLNQKLSKNDNIVFNHNGIIFDSDSIEMYKSRIFNEEERLEVLHDMEINLVRYCKLHLGTPSSEMIGFDSGCGGGGSSIMIHKDYGCEMEGCTLSQGQADFGNMAAEKYGISNKVRFFQANMLDTGMPSNRYDFVWACESTEHILLKDLSKMFEEFSRISKKNARLALIAWTGQQGLHKIADRIKQEIDDHYLTDIHTPEEYTTAACSQGWKLLKEIDISHLTLPYWELRAESENKTGSEKSFIEGFRNKALKYVIYVYQLTEK